VRVATFNLHAGVDGWGRPTRVLEVVKELNADLLVLPELWRADDGPDFYEDLSTSLAMTGAFVPLAKGERVTSGAGSSSWQPLLAHFVGERGLFFGEHRKLTKDQLANRALLEHVERGTWGLGLLTRLPVEDVSVIPLGRLPREKVNRAVIVARLNDGTRPFYALAVHGAHISHGSYRQYRRINTIVASLEPGVPVVVAGDFNCWRPLLRVLFPGWRTLARGRTWPSQRPHSQIDHILGRGPWVSERSFTRDGGSDHLALIADVELRQVSSI
jgi:endonuclease/exonuclease/phosphatase family metal-dependent hydrolase